MTIAEAEKYFINELSNYYPYLEINSLFFYWINSRVGLSKTAMILQKDTQLISTQKKDLDNTINRLKQHEPIQYILAETTFYDLPFRVKKGVLIPRPETEELVTHIIRQFSRAKNLKILDIGTGSGCIAVTLAKYLDATVYAIDISTDAIAIASENAEMNNVAVNFVQVDILTERLIDMGDFDIIVSNPPYVLTSEKKVMAVNVINYEPSEALFVPDDNPLMFYSKIIENAKTMLAPQGQLFFEINEKQGKNIQNLLVESDFKNIVLWQDIHGKDRFIKGRL